MATALVGCSGWVYRDWRGPVYPERLPQRSWLGWYAEHLPMVEVNGTFYGLPAPATVERWRDAAPPGFVFVLKLSAFGTHRKHLREPETWLPRFVERAVLLGPALGPVLVQLPPRWQPDPARLDAFLVEAARQPVPAWAVEVRDPRWLRDDVYEVLARHRVPLVWHDLLPDHPLVVTGGWRYVRFHGPDALARPYHGRYPDATLRGWSRRLRDEVAAGADVVVAFNNDVGGAGFHDAVRLRRLLARPRRAAAPAP